LTLKSNIRRCRVYPPGMRHGFDHKTLTVIRAQESPRTALATLKKIMIPVTSTNVATKGLDAIPGSILIFLNISGSIDPTNVPQIHIPATEMLITTANPTNETGSLGKVHRLGNW